MILSTSCCEEKTLGSVLKLPCSHPLPTPEVPSPSFLLGLKAENTHWAMEEDPQTLDSRRLETLPSLTISLHFGSLSRRLSCEQTRPIK